MRIARILFVAILLFSGATILATASLAQKIISDSSVLSGAAGVMEDLKFQQLLKDDYQSQLITCLHDYSAGSLSDSAFQDRLLSFKTPAEYKDLHFKLVSSFDGMRDKHLSGEAKNSLIELGRNYTWLSSVLSLLISNNF